MPRSRREPEPEPEPEVRSTGLFARAMSLVTRPLRRAWSSPDPLDDYALVHFTSVLGDAFIAVALADSVFFGIPVGEARDKVALYLLLTVAPLAFAAPLIVPLLDRAGPRRSISFAAAMLRAGLAVYLAPRTGSLVLFPVAFGLLMLSRAHGVTKNGLTIAYAPPGEGLVQANARLGRWAVAGGMLAIPPGAAILKAVGPAAVVYCAAAAYVVSGLLNWRLPHPRVPDVETTAGKRGRLPELRVAAFGAGAIRAASGFFIFLIAFAARVADIPPWQLGVLAVVAAMGGFLADVVAPRVPRRLREEGVVLTSLVVAAGAAVVALWVETLVGLSIFAGLVGLSTEFGRLAFGSLAQRHAPPGAQGSVFVRYEVFFQLAWVVGAFIPAMIEMPFRTGVWIMAGFYGACAALYLMLPESRSRHEPDDGFDLPV